MNTLGESDQGQIMSAALAYGQAFELQTEITGIQSDIEAIESGDAALKVELIKVLIARSKQLDQKRRLLNVTLAELTRFEADLGLNPTARTRIKLDKPAPASRRERLLG